MRCKDTETAATTRIIRCWLMFLSVTDRGRDKQHGVSTYLSQCALVSERVNAKTEFCDLACSSLALSLLNSSSMACFSCCVSHCLSMSPTICSATAVGRSLFTRSLGLTSRSVVLLSFIRSATFVIGAGAKQLLLLGFVLKLIMVSF